MTDAKKKFTPPKRIYLQCPDDDDGGPLDLIHDDVLGYVDDPDSHSVAYILETGTLRETEDCPVCVSPHPHNEEWLLTKPGPCWRCHGERRVII